MKLIGTSFSKCLSDIANGYVDVDDVYAIICGTDSTAIDWTKHNTNNSATGTTSSGTMFTSYNIRLTELFKVHNGYFKGVEEQATAAFDKLLINRLFIEPRVTGAYPLDLGWRWQPFINYDEGRTEQEILAEITEATQFMKAMRSL